MRSTVRVKKSGHKACINCIDATTVSRNLVATGSDDKSIRIWDIRADKAIKCITHCFESAVEAVRFSFKDENTIYAACDKSLFAFDLRAEGVIIKTPVMISSSASDDINSITVRPGGNYLGIDYPDSDSKGNEFLAVADDSGMITVVDTLKFNVYQPRRLSGHTSLVSAVAFSPCNANILVSGGFDYLLHSWDLDTTRDTPISSINVTQIGPPNTEAFSGKSINPPFVQSISYVCGGRGVVVALGDGSLKVVDADDTRNLLAEAPDAHAGMVTALFSSGGNILYSGGVDRSVKCWKLEDNIALAARKEKQIEEECTLENLKESSKESKESKELDLNVSSLSFENSLKNESKNIEVEIKNNLLKTKEKLDKEKKAKNKKKKNRRFAGNNYSMQFSLLWDEDHVEKINVICGFRMIKNAENDGQLDQLNKLFVGDVSNYLTIYNLE